MVKQAERVHKRSPLLPIYGIVIAIGLGVVAYMLMTYITGPLTPFPQIRDMVASLGGGRDFTAGRVFITLAIWFIMLGIAYFLVSIVVGKNPDSPQNIAMPPRHTKKKEKKRF